MSFEKQTLQMTPVPRLQSVDLYKTSVYLQIFLSLDIPIHHALSIVKFKKSLLLLLLLNFPFLVCLTVFHSELYPNS